MAARVLLVSIACTVLAMMVSLRAHQPSAGRAPCGIGWLSAPETPCDD
jgi:hypothetical protein